MDDMNKDDGEPDKKAAKHNDISKLIPDLPSTHDLLGKDLVSPAYIARLQELLSHSPALASMTRMQGELAKQVQASLGPALANFGAYQRDLIAGLQPLFRQTLSHANDFKVIEEAPSPYSAEMTSAASYFERDQEVVDSFDSLNSKIVSLIEKNPSLNLVWRGQQDAAWGLHSGLFRRLMEVNGVKSPEDAPKESQPYPDEGQLVRAEQEILSIARDRWRLDGKTALEIFARVQHHGGPTRLIDVTRNPYIGAWFAVEGSDRLDHSPARLFAVAMAPVMKDGERAPDNLIRLDESGGTREPFWHALLSSQDRQGADWGTGAKRRIWVPPAYDGRIVAQNAGFLLDGVPMMSAGIAPYFKIASGSSYWKKADLLAASSIYLKTAKASQKARRNAKNLAPTFTFLITPEGKADIRRVLEERFSYNHSTIYPDISGLANYLSANLADIVT